MKEKATSAVWRKGFLALAVAALLAAALGLCACGSSSSTTTTSDSSSDSDSPYASLDSVTLILADNTSKGSAGNLWGEAIAEKAAEITDGKLNIDYHGTSELGGDADLLRQEQANDIQMVICQPAPMASFVSDLAVFDLPLAFATYDGDQIDEVLNGDNDFTEALEASFEDAGFHNLGWLQNATFRETTSNRDLSTLADFSGFQIRTMENPNHMAFWQAIGAEPTPLAWSETYFALQNGTVEGQENATDTCVGASIQEVQKYVAMTNHILYANNVSINQECWEGLDEAYQEALVQAIEEATEEIRPQLAEMNEENLKVMEDAGCTVIEYDQSFFDEILANADVQQIYTDISSSTNGLSDKMLEALEAA